MTTHDSPLHAALAELTDPLRPGVPLPAGLIRSASLTDGTAQVTLAPVVEDRPDWDALVAMVHDAARAAGAQEVRTEVAPLLGDGGQEALPGIRRMVAVGSGKGGVGKSTVAANLAVAFAREGANVGLLDADIYGPSQARMFGVEGRRLMADEEKRILPLRAHGVRLISIANLVEDGQALTWRGPILHGTLKQMLEQTVWGELDLMLVDLPPGTGDVQLSLTQLANVTGAVLVTTPQEVALADVRRAYTMMRKTHVPVLGAVQNMSWYELPDGSRDPVFGEGAARAWCEKERLELLAEIGMARELRESGDDGTPLTEAHPQAKTSQAFVAAAYGLARALQRQASATLPVL